MRYGAAVNGQDLLDPEIAPLTPTIDLDGLDEAMLAQMRLPVPGLGSTAAVAREDITIPGEPNVTVRVHRPVGASGTLPAMLRIHGGGYVLGSYDMDDPTFEEWCPRFGLVGVSVEYRLAPETPYPGPHEDCFRALRWMHDNAAQLGIDPARIGISGISAGGGLAAGVTLRARDEGVPIAFQLLEAPMIDDRQITVSSQLDKLLVWSRGANTFGWKSYLGSVYGTDDIPVYAAPARATDLAGLPPTFVNVGGADGFRDEDIDYAMRLNGAGVPTELHVYPGGPHGYQMFQDSTIARRSQRDRDEWLGVILERLAETSS
jgi:acetyl esterase/lipase